MIKAWYHGILTIAVIISNHMRFWAGKMKRFLIAKGPVPKKLC